MAERDWIATTGEILGIMALVGGTAGRWFHNKLEDSKKEAKADNLLLKIDIDGVGERVGELALDHRELRTKVEANERKLLVMEFQHNAIEGHLHRLEGIVEKMAELEDKRAEAHGTRYEEIRDRLARIEENNKLCETLDKSLTAIAETLARRA
jgi:hypothetical protein